MPIALGFKMKASKNSAPGDGSPCEGEAWIECKNRIELNDVERRDVGPVHVAYGSDVYGWDLLTTSIASLVRHFDKNGQLIIHVVVPKGELSLANELAQELRNCFAEDLGVAGFADGQSGSHRHSKTRGTSNRHQLLVHGATTRPHKLNTTGIGGHGFASSSSLFRIFLADMLPTVNRVVWLDTDTIINVDISYLYQVKTKHAIAAALSPTDFINEVSSTQKGAIARAFMGQAASCHADAIRLSLGADLQRESFFQSGVMILDLAQWRSKDLVQKVMEYGDSDVIRWCWSDQIALNAVFRNSAFDVLDWQWNVGQLNAPNCPTLQETCNDQVWIAHLNGGDKCRSVHGEPVSCGGSQFWSRPPGSCLKTWQGMSH
jgi:hypothetical protein